MTLRWTAAEFDAYLDRMEQRRQPPSGDVFPLTLNLRLPSMANERLHPLARARIVKTQRSTVAKAIGNRPMPELPLTVTITRIGPRKLDSDNLATSCKHVRDALAAAWGVDDGSDLYDWRYTQEKGGKGVYGVRVEVSQ